MLLLAGDIGGTTTRLAFFRVAGTGLETVAQSNYQSRGHGSLAAIVQALLNRDATAASAGMRAHFASGLEAAH